VFLKVGGIAPLGAILNGKGATGGRNNMKGAKCPTTNRSLS